MCVCVRACVRACVQVQWLAWSTVVQTAVRCVKQCSLKSAVDRPVSLLSVAVMSSLPARSTRSLSATYLVLRRRRQYDSVADSSASPITNVKSPTVLCRLADLRYLPSVCHDFWWLLWIAAIYDLLCFVRVFVQNWNSDLFGLLVVIVMLTIYYCDNVKSNQSVAYVHRQ